MKKLAFVGAWLIASLTAPTVHSQDVRPMNNDAQDIVVAQHLIDRHFEIWNERDKAMRVGKFPTVYTPDIFVSDYAEIASGYANVNRLIERVQTEHAGFAFTPDPVSWNHGLGRVTWGYGPKDNPNLVRGEDIFSIHDGKLASLRVFLNKN
ncbi:nuclear transport factor 2 family protein [Paraburkholderia sp. BR14320]|uniref:nuclear transport factor 2 family protein n=1 Tax=unclassified Paraburkholderia TaxID=2615204 RepID=UPI0034CDFB36